MLATMNPATMNPATMTVGGTDYLLMPAKIESTSLGYEDHGIFTGVLMLAYAGSSAQGAGMMILDAPLRDEIDKVVKRVGTAYGLDWIIRVLNVVGVDSWEHVKGQRLFALKTAEWGGYVEGLANIDRPETNYLVFKAHADEWKEEK